jgi:glycosyltransferase involved in cell wall biosynthesis
VQALLNDTSIFVQSSTAEGFGLTAVEAMLCGAALVTTDCGGSRDYAFHDHTALVSAPRDADQLADHALALLDDAPRRVRIAEAGNREARGFTWERAASEFEAALYKIVENPQAYGRPSR